MSRLEMGTKGCVDDRTATGRGVDVQFGGGGGLANTCRDGTFAEREKAL